MTKPKATVETLKHNQMVRESQHETEKQHLRDEVTRLSRLTENQTIRFDNMFRSSEAMRNRQVDIINRLLDGGTIPDELTMALRELAELKVKLDNTQEHLNTRSKELAQRESEVADLRARVDDLHEKLYGTAPTNEEESR